MDRVFFAIGSISAAIAVIAGAFGAHALKDKLEPDRLAVFETATRYQFFHALALLAVSWALTKWNVQFATIAGWLFILGTVLFSGSLYALSLSGIKILGAITPFGGLAFIIGWIALAISAL